MRRILVVITSVALAACQNLGSSDSGGASKPGAPTAAPAAAPSDGLADVDLAPLPLTIRVPKGGGGAFDMTIGDKKSVTVDIGEGGAMNIQEMVEKSLAELKDGYKKDTILLPFKKAVKEDATSFVFEVAPDGKQGFVGVTVKEIAGKKYVCKTTGLNGVKTAEIAAKNLEFCNSLKAK